MKCSASCFTLSALLLNIIIGISYPASAYSEQVHPSLSHGRVFAGSALDGTTDFELWVKSETLKSVQNMFKNISPAGTAPGAVIASPSRSNPDYYYHWVRDAALVMGVVVDFYEASMRAADRAQLESILSDYVEFSRRNQVTPNRSGGLGEPKFNVDGSAFNLDWGRPQNDGPALRAITLTRYAKILLANPGYEAWVKSRLYDGRIPTESVIKADLEFISHHWQESSYDLWEETLGQHFYTRMVQRRALLDGAELADQLGDPRAAGWYRLQASLLSTEIDKHWDSQRGYLLVTLNADSLRMRPEDLKKSSGLDVAIVLAVLHGSRGDGFYTPSDEKILISAQKIQEAFQGLYPINRNTQLGTAIGRYPEDIYDGNSIGVNPGNPWVLATCAYAELYYRIASEWAKKGEIRVTNLNFPFFDRLLRATQSRMAVVPGSVYKIGSPEYYILHDLVIRSGDQFLKRVQFHTPSDGSFAEQMNRFSGFMQGAVDLTWSYASFLTAISQRFHAGMFRMSAIGGGLFFPSF